jgi:uncharacterized protein YecT (DUF1311 family)
MKVLLNLCFRTWSALESRSAQTALPISQRASMKTKAKSCRNSLALDYSPASSCFAILASARNQTIPAARPVLMFQDALLSQYH